MDDIPDIRLPFSRRVGEVLWRTIKRPRLDRWIQGADWLYCPKELYAPVKNARVAVTVHDLYALEPAFRNVFSKSTLRWEWLLRRALTEADLVLAVSNFTKGRLVELLGIDPGKIRIVGNGVDPDFFAIAHADPKAVSPIRNTRYVLSVGGLTPKKGASALLELARRLKKDEPSLVLVVVGPVDRSYSKELENLPNLRLMARGFPDSEMCRLVRGAEAMVLLSEYEGFGMPALEAMAAGTPVVAADRASLPEVVGNAAVLVEPSDSRQTCDAILDLMTNCSHADLLKSRGRSRANLFQWDDSVNCLVEALIEFEKRPKGGLH